MEKNVSFTLLDSFEADGSVCSVGFLVYEVYYHEDSYGFFSSEEVAKKHVVSLTERFNNPYFNIATHFVNFD